MSNAQLLFKPSIREFLRQEFEAVPAKRATSGKVHLEVWRTPEKRRPVGVEMGHEGQVNFWLVRLNMPKYLPDSILVVMKEPKGRVWTDATGDGANSNLSAYDEFRTKPIVRLAVASIEDARFVLESLLP